MSYKDVNKPELIRGIKFWQNPNNKIYVLMLHYTADEKKDPKRKGRLWYKNEKIGVPTYTWEKEYEINFETKSGKLIYGPEFCDLDPKVHFINSFDIPEPYELLISVDFGQRNPTATLIGVWTQDNKLFIIDEYYKPGIPSKTSREMFKKFSYLFPEKKDNVSNVGKRELLNDIFQLKVIDPSVRAKNRTRRKMGEEIEYSVLEEFYDNGWDFSLGNNDVASGINRVREYFKINKDGETSIYIFKDKCPHLIEELQHYRYKEYSDAVKRTRNDSEEPVKKNDHACVSGDSIVKTKKGNIKIKDLIGKTGKVLGYNKKKKKFVLEDFENVAITGKRKTIEIYLSNKKKLILTGDHPVMLKNGKYQNAGALKVGDKLMSLNQYCEIVKIEKGKKINVYNMEVKNIHNFVCQDTVIHNCDALRYLIMTRPINPEKAKKPLTKIQKDIQSKLKPRVYMDEWNT